MKTVNVAIIGTKFMGKAHSNAWSSAPRFFDLELTPVLKVACGKNEKGTADFARNWGWEEVSTDWREVVKRPDVDIVDISTPTYLHRDIAIAAAQNGKQIFCEKPIALSYTQAKEMYEAVEKAGVLHYLNHNYRRTPAVTLAKQMIDEGKIGQIFHWRGAYLQDWITDPNFPLTWHLRKEMAGAGPHYDLNSHSVDLARYLVGELAAVSAIMKQFYAKRPLPGTGAGTFKSGSGGAEMAEQTVEDASFMVAEFENGAIGSFEASRFASGRKNYNYFEIYGSKGSLAFDLERMNELMYLDLEDPSDEQGFRTILVTNSTHPYVGAWWPPGHIIGYEHEFTHAVADFLKAMANGTPIKPNFLDGMKIMQVLEAGLLSASTGRKVAVSEIQ
ncbi:MAG TPA: Gfo/Idh/MocA family oxidoreductase [Anaerolineaceae bacterium]|nr:Gfo/Idh/MocA family oxidoreductase [Anaerolineaceae bacterium]